MAMSENPSNYGTLPPSTPPPRPTTTNSARKPPRPPPSLPQLRPPQQPSTTFLSRTRSETSTRRPWRVFFNYTQFSLPYHSAEAMSRVRRNFSHFRVNYTMVILLIIFLSLIYHPLSMIVFLIIGVAWLMVYFNESPIVISGAHLDDRLVLVGLGLVTVIALAFTHVGLNVLVALIIGFLLLGLHGSIRGTDDLFLDENEAVEGGLVSVVSEEEQIRPSYR